MGLFSDPRVEACPGRVVAGVTAVAITPVRHQIPAILTVRRHIRVAQATTPVHHRPLQAPLSWTHLRLSRVPPAHPAVHGCLHYFPHLLTPHQITRAIPRLHIVHQAALVAYRTMMLGSSQSI